MSNEQRYLRALFGGTDVSSFPTEEMQSAFQRIGTRLMEAADVEAELRSLYKVEGFSEFALSLLWLSRQARGNPSKTEPTAEEREILLARFPFLTGGPSTGMPEIELPSPAVPDVSVPAEEPVQELPPQPVVPSAAAGPPSEAVSESEFALLMEQFVEAMQGGDETRTTLMDRIVEAARGISAEGSGADAELREYCSLFVTFLDYVVQNQFMDDVRVMNILSNISAPVSGWVSSAPGERSGQLSDGIEVLRGFKSMFE
jgi:hypothetical protein